jgi:hypothetical protein
LQSVKCASGHDAGADKPHEGTTGDPQVMAQNPAESISGAAPCLRAAQQFPR